MPAEVIFIGGLGSGHLVEGLFGERLRCGQIAMPLRADIAAGKLARADADKQALALINGLGPATLAARQGHCRLPMPA